MSTSLTDEQYDLIVVAIRANVERGHFQEAHEGFNDCPAVGNDGLVEGKRKGLYADEPLGECECGLVQAEAAMLALGLEFSTNVKCEQR
jgi:hypothetical protein